MPLPIRFDSQGFDLSKRFQVYTTVDASPSAATETVIATLNLTGFSDTAFVKGAVLMGWAAYTVGTSGVSVQLRIRQTNVSGTVVANSGALTGSQHGAGVLSADDVNGFDTSPVAAYALTMQVASAAAASTVSSLWLAAILI